VANRSEGILQSILKLILLLLLERSLFQMALTLHYVIIMARLTIIFQAAGQGVDSLHQDFLQMVLMYLTGFR